jgi:tetratricopeptide (TPR) repeat protein
LARSGDLDRAFADYEKAMEIDPERTLSYLSERRNQPERAVADLDSAAKANPNTAVIYHIRGKFHEMLGRLDLALADYEKAATLNSRFARPCASDGFVFKEWDELGKREETIEANVNANPNAASAYFNRGALLHGKRKYGWAILDYDKTLELDPAYAPARYNRGVAYESRDDFERAFADYHRAAELDPGSACYARARGMARYRKGDFSGAAADLSRATAVRPDADTILFRYLARRRLGEHADPELRADASRITGPDWAPRIIDLYLGLRSPEELEFHPDCRTSFYLGQWHLINGHAAEAEAALKGAAGRYCRRDDLGYQAKAELLRLKR